MWAVWQLSAYPRILQVALDSVCSMFKGKSQKACKCFDGRIFSSLARIPGILAETMRKFFFCANDFYYMKALETLIYSSA
jgi:hypothetical protein